MRTTFKLMHNSLYNTFKQIVTLNEFQMILNVMIIKLTSEFCFIIQQIPIYLGNV